MKRNFTCSEELFKEIPFLKKGSTVHYGVGKLLGNLQTFMGRVSKIASYKSIETFGGKVIFQKL